MIKFRTFTSFAEIIPTEIYRETDQSVFIRRGNDERRQAKISDCYCYHDTWNGARNHLIAQATNDVERAAAKLQYEQDKLAKIMALKTEETK